MKTYQINNIQIEWGKTLSQAAALLNLKTEFGPYGGRPYIKCNCSAVFGIKTTQAELRAPFEDRPVMQVAYEVAPLKAGFLQKLHDPYLRQLTETLGKPVKTKSLYHQPHINKAYMWSAVVFSATWLFDDIRVSLSVYGGVRDNDGAPSGAGIFVDWIDEVKAAAPYKDAVDKKGNDISRLITNGALIEKFKLEYEQRAFTITHYELEDPYIAQHDPVIRVSQLALYKPALFPTPQIIQDQLLNNEIAVVSCNDDELLVANKWDATMVSKAEQDQMIYYELLPARGPGRRELEVNGLNIQDSNKSNMLLALIEKIEEQTGSKIRRETAYDD